MQILRLLAARRAASLASQRRDAGEYDEGAFFDLNFSSCSVPCSVRASSYSSGTLSDSDSDDDDQLDFVISLQRRPSASPLCASEPPARANSLQSQRHGGRKRGITLRSLSFGARKAAPLYRRPSLTPSLASSSSGQHSFARTSKSSSRSLRLFMHSPPRAAEDHEHDAAEPGTRAPSRDVIRRYAAKISRRFCMALCPRAAEARGIRRLRKCRSASSAAPPASRCDDDSAVEKQDGIAGAIAHCKDSLHRGAWTDFSPAASVSKCDLPLVRSRSDPGKCEAAP